MSDKVVQIPTMADEFFLMINSLRTFLTILLSNSKFLLFTCIAGYQQFFKLVKITGKPAAFTFSFSFSLRNANSIFICGILLSGQTILFSVYCAIKTVH
jgi:hypothetical protein